MKIEVIQSAKGRYYWRIVARNGRTLAHSEQYNTKRAAVAAATLVRDGAGAAELVLPGEA